MLRDLFELAKKLFEVTDGLKQAKDEKRQKIENFFYKIEQCLRHSAEALHNSQTPRIKAELKELRVYAEELPNILKDIYNEKKINELSNLLYSAANKIEASNTPEDYIEDIETAAGMFKGLAVIVSTQTQFDSQNQQKKGNSKSFASLLNRRNFLITSVLASSGVIGVGFAKFQMPNVRWKMANFLNKNSQQLILAKAPQIICERIEQITRGRFKIELDSNEKILTEEILRQVSDGNEVQCGFSGIYYNNNKYKVLFFGSSIPHGLTPQEQTAWLLYKKRPNDKLTFIQEIYQRPELGLNVIPFPIAATGAQMGGWFKKQVENMEDFNGITMRIPGLGGEVLRDFNVKLDKDLPGGAIPTHKIAEALKKGIIQAAEWVGPYDDLLLGLHKAQANYYYYPGWWEPSTTFDMLVNKDAWNNLPLQYQEIFKAVCWETYTDILVEYNQKNSEKLEEIRSEKHGKIVLSKFSPQIIQETQVKTQKLLEYYASTNDLFKEVYDEWQIFKKRIREWSKLN